MKSLLLSVVGAALFSASAGAADIPAKLAWSERAELGTLVSGIVAKVHVRPGQTIKSGQVLVSLDRREFNADVKRASAVSDKANVALEEALLDAERNAEMYERTIISDRELKLSQIETKNAEAEAALAKAELTKARLAVEHSRVSAPFSGVVIAVLASPGQAVVSRNQSYPLVVVANNAQMLAQGNISSRNAATVHPGDALSVTVGEQNYQGNVVSVGLEPIEMVGDKAYYQLSVAFKASGVLRAGESATITLP